MLTIPYTIQDSAKPFFNFVIERLNQEAILEKDILTSSEKYLEISRISAALLQK